MKDIPHAIAGFIRFLNLNSLRARTLEAYLSRVTRRPCSRPRHRW
jgi:hypothetical protein